MKRYISCIIIITFCFLSCQKRNSALQSATLVKSQKTVPPEYEITPLQEDFRKKFRSCINTGQFSKYSDILTACLLIIRQSALDGLSFVEIEEIIQMMFFADKWKDIDIDIINKKLEYILERSLEGYCCKKDEDSLGNWNHSTCKCWETFIEKAFGDKKSEDYISGICCDLYLIHNTKHCPCKDTKNGPN